MHQDVHNNLKEDDLLVIKSNAEQGSTSAGENYIAYSEPSFSKQNHWLEAPPIAISELALRHLSGQVTRNKHDLYSMVKKIYLLKAMKDQDRLASAVFDLLICLGDKGKALQKRILHSVQEQLDASHQLVQTSVSNTARVPESISQNSLFHRGIWGSTDIVSKDNQHIATPSNQLPLEEAKDMLNQGDILGATAILEKALLENPQDEDISNELFLIYKHTHDHTAIERMLEKLKDKNVSYVSQWKELSQRLQKEAAPE